MSYRHAICLVVDGLRASALGTYGNTTFPTPQIDALAGHAVVAEGLYADSPQLASFYRSVWSNVHALRPVELCEPSLVLKQLQSAGVRQWLLTDDAWLTEQAVQLPFDEALLFENIAEQAAVQIEDTALARFFSEAIERLHQWREDVADTHSLMWLHSRGMHGPWDAPLAMRAGLLDEEDPVPADFVEPPSALREIEDPDVLLMHRVAYAAQVRVLDACVGAFVQAIQDEFADSDTLVMLVGSRGFALGEHGSIGTDCTGLFNEQMHLPWLVYQCGNASPLPRLDALCQPTDIGATLLDWFGGEASAKSREQFPHDGISMLPSLGGIATGLRTLAVSTNDRQECAVRTPGWMLMQAQSGSEPCESLFTKPDDRWENNDVAGLCLSVVEELQQERASFEQSCRKNNPLPTDPQVDSLSETL